MKYKIIDIFCGIGGFSYGFEMTRKFETILGIDVWDVALKTFSRNHPKTNVLKGDVTQINDDYFKKFKGKADVIIVGPPCQGFSMSGRRDVFDVRNSLFHEVIRIVREVEPKVVVIENVVGLLSMQTPDGVPVRDEIIRNLKALDYNVDCKVLTASDFGVPQNRKRVIFIASKKGDISFPAPSVSKPVTVGEALSNIPEDGVEYGEVENKYQKLMKGRKDILNHSPINHAPLITKRMHHIPQGGNWQDIPIELGQGGGKHSNNYRRLKWDEPSITIKHVSKSMIIHPLYDRTPTIREVARIQSFDDNFEILGTIYNQHQQLANAVPPLLGKAIATSVYEILSNYEIKND